MNGTPPAGPDMGVPPPGTPPGAGQSGPEGPEEGPGAQDQPSLEEEQALLEALRDRDVSDTEVKIPRAEEDQLVQLILRDVFDANGLNSVMKTRHARFVDVWRGTPEEKDTPYEGAANIRTPITSAWFEQTKARLLKALLGDVTFSSLDNSIPQDSCDEVAGWFNYELEENIKIETLLGDIIHNTLLDGLALPMPCYERSTRRQEYVTDFEYDETRGLQEQLDEAILDIFKNEDPELDTVKDYGDYTIVHKLSGDPEEHEATITFSLKGERIYAKVQRDVVMFDGVVVEIPLFEDIVAPNNGNDVNEITFFVHRTYLSRYDVEKGFKDGRFRKFDIDEEERIAESGTIKLTTVVQKQTTRHLDLIEGTDSLNLPHTHPSRQFLEVYRWEGKWPLGDGPPVALAVWVCERARRILKIQRLEQLNKDGLRTPVPFEYIREPGRFYPMGFVEWMDHCQNEMDAIHRQRLDAGQMTNMPFGMYEPAAGMPAEKIKIEPGLLVPVKDTSKVVFPKMNFNSQWSFQDEALARRNAQEQAGLSESAVGVFPTKRLSASEFVGTQGSVDLRTEQMVLRIARSYKQLLTRIFGLYQQYMPDGRVYQVTGQKGERIVKSLKRDRLHGNYMLAVSSSVEQLAQEQERQNATAMFTVFANPALIQLGIVTPVTIYIALKKLMSVLHYENVPIQYPTAPAISESPEHEHKQMGRGEQVRPSMADDHQMHLNEHWQFASAPMLDTYFGDAPQRLLAEHIQGHQVMFAQKQQLQQQQAAMMSQVQDMMNQMGVRPGRAGSSQPGSQTGPGTSPEGVGGGPPQ